VAFWLAMSGSMSESAMRCSGGALDIRDDFGVDGLLIDGTKRIG